MDHFSRDSDDGAVKSYRGRDIYAKRAPVPGVLLEVQRLCPEAEHALEPEEYEDRIARYTRLVERNLPLPLFGCEQPPEPQRVLCEQTEMACWACGVIAPRAGNQASRRAPVNLKKPTRPAPMMPDDQRTRPASKREKARHRAALKNHAKRMEEYKRAVAEARETHANRWESRMLWDHTTETYCRACFLLWGWPDGYDPIEALADGVVAALNEWATRAERNRPCGARSVAV